MRDAVVASVGEGAMGLGIERQQVAVVLEHLLVVRHAPVALRRITEESAGDMVVHTS